MADQPDWTVSQQTFVESVPILAAVIPGSGAVTYTVPLDLSPWPSIVVLLQPVELACIITYQWLDDTDAFIIDEGFLYVSVLATFLPVRLVTKSKTLRLLLSNVSAGFPITVDIFGSTVVVDVDQVMGQQIQVVSLTPTWVAGIPQALGSFYSNGKPCYMSAVVGGAANKGFWGYFYTNAANVQVFVTLGDTGEGHSDALANTALNRMILLPRGYITLAFDPETAGIYVVQIAITPGI